MEVVGKFYLSNAWLRYATSCAIATNYSFVARLDDDALVNGSAIGGLLARLLHERYVAMGSIRHWYNWEPKTYYAVCWANNANRARTSRMRFGALLKARWPAGSPLGHKPSLWAIGRWASAHVESNLTGGEGGEQIGVGWRQGWRQAASNARSSGYTERATQISQAERMLERDRCLHSEGPFPFVAGPFMVFSHTLAAEMMSLPAVAADEQKV